jgi:3-hydroxybutyryl-CoA dehydrogenase
MVNSILAVALSLVIDGHADLEDVDRSWMLTHNPEIGPFGMIDEKGLDVLHNELEESAKENPLLEEPLKPIFAFLQNFIEKGELGVKTGKGFYTYPDPEFKKPEFLLRTD